jgi:hypothetical protein
MRLCGSATLSFLGPKRMFLLESNATTVSDMVHLFGEEWACINTVVML